MTTEDGRRLAPEAILARVQREEREKKRGRLRIYLGAFPGVGKTYAMLNEAHRRTNYGEDVVVGFVETHGRRATGAQLEGLEVLPRRRVEYHGVTIEELDVDAVLARNPAVCLIDELAHTNAPGSSREKRYEDVEVILNAGVDVVTTLNIQHIESLNDTVEAMTGVKVRETIPDSIVEEADEIILIDMTPEGARARLQHGHIYPPAQAAAALEGFFRPSNLAALREMALRRTAEEVDEQLEAFMRESGRDETTLEERVLVYIDASPFARTLNRRGWRLAEAFRGELLVAYLKRPLGEREQNELARTIELAEDLNARIVPMEGRAEAGALSALMEAEGAQHVVLAGRPRKGLNPLASSLIDKLMAGPTKVDVHVVSARN